MEKAHFHQKLCPNLQVETSKWTLQWRSNHLSHLESKTVVDEIKVLNLFPSPLKIDHQNPLCRVLKWPKIAKNMWTPWLSYSLWRSCTSTPLIYTNSISMTSLQFPIFFTHKIHEWIFNRFSFRSSKVKHGARLTNWINEKSSGESLLTLLNRRFLTYKFIKNVLRNSINFQSVLIKNFCHPRNTRL